MIISHSAKRVRDVKDMIILPYILRLRYKAIDLKLNILE